MSGLVPGDLFIRPREPEEIIAEAMAFKPCAVFVGFSGGDDSLGAAHWMMSNVPGCEVLHVNTGIGIGTTRRFVRETCAAYGWPLHEVSARDCGQDYRQIVLEHGFPGPAQHVRMYARLKERAIRKVVRERKTRPRDKVLIATGIHKQESQIRMGYVERQVSFVGAQMWVNPLYWWPKERFSDYIKEHGLKRNPVSEMLGMSGECLCGAFAHPGEKALIRLVEPETADYLDRLEVEVRAAGHDWGWEERPPRQVETIDHPELPGFRPLCRGCEK